MFSGHYRAHGYRYQGIACPNGIIEHLWGPVEGRHHDCYLLWMSDVLDELRAFTDENDTPYYIYGDPAYPLNPHLLAPYKRLRLTASETDFNRRYSSVRIMVEWMFGRVTQLWRGMDFIPTERSLSSPLGSKYCVAVILTNIYTCMQQGNQSSKYFNNVRVPTLSEYLDHPNAPTVCNQ